MAKGSRGMGDFLWNFSTYREHSRGYRRSPRVLEKCFPPIILKHPFLIFPENFFSPTFLEAEQSFFPG